MSDLEMVELYSKFIRGLIEIKDVMDVMGYPNSSAGATGVYRLVMAVRRVHQAKLTVADFERKNLDTFKQVPFDPLA